MTEQARAGRTGAGEAVIERAARLLAAFTADHRQLSLAELSRRSGIPRSSALRLARKLVDVGALERRSDGAFVVGLRLLEVATLAPRGHGLRAVAMPYMEDLFAVTRQHVLLAVRDGDDALLVERLSAHGAMPVQYRVGGRLPLTSTGVGLVLLAHAPADVQERTIEEFVPSADTEIRSPAELRRTLAEVRRGGFARGRQSEPWSVSTVAAPVRAPDGAVVAALSVVVPTGGPDLGTYVHVVQTTALAVTRELNYSSVAADRTPT
ncbi:IclR family transcriptional regulator [Cryobacterium adonitolivorans]|uniref:IclR family transcriptional regulator n=1 Tax=Cryobacterium adonitolivorans TaxID=1259189 RepID=A0A4R8WG55_9MICO|nr:IclR family transcriptional regulator [Cryobacterium adonitolivorans]TFC06944.1 IclR family transcriptional regulator [Cryobacterium adonitolivorans]